MVTIRENKYIRVKATVLCLLAILGMLFCGHTMTGSAGLSFVPFGTFTAEAADSGEEEPEEDYDISFRNYAEVAANYVDRCLAYKDEGAAIKDSYKSGCNLGGFTGYIAEKDNSTWGRIKGFLGWGNTKSEKSWSYSTMQSAYGKSYDSDYVKTGRALQFLSYDNTNNSGQNFGRLIVGAITMIAVIAAKAVNYIFDILFMVLDVANPFRFFKESTTLGGVGFTDPGHIGTPVSSVDAFLQRMTGFFSKTYDSFADFAFQVVIPFTFMLLLIGFFLFRSYRSNFAHHLRPFLIRSAFIIVGIPFLGMFYTDALNSLANSFTISGSFIADVVCHTFFDFEGYVQGTSDATSKTAHHGMQSVSQITDMILDTGAGKDPVKAGAINHIRSMCWDCNKLSCGALNNASSPTTDTNSIQMRPGDFDATSGNTQVGMTESESGIEYAYRLVGSYFDKRQYTCSQYESFAKQNVSFDKKELGRMMASTRRYAFDEEDGKAGDASEKIKLPTGYFEGDEEEVETRNSYFNAPYQPFTDGTDNTYLSTMSTYNYLSTVFDSSGLTVYTPSAPSAYSKVQHYSVNLIGQGILMKFVLVFNAWVMLFGYVILACTFVFRTAIHAVFNGFDVMAESLFAAIGMYKAIARCICAALCTIAEVFISVLFFSLATEMMYLLSYMVDDVTNNSGGAYSSAFGGAMTITVGVLLSTIMEVFFIKFCIQWRGHIVKAFQDNIREIIEKVMGVQMGAGMGAGAVAGNVAGGMTGGALKKGAALKNAAGAAAGAGLAAGAGAVKSAALDHAKNAQDKKNANELPGGAGDTKAGAEGATNINSENADNSSSSASVSDEQKADDEAKRAARADAGLGGDADAESGKDGKSASASAGGSADGKDGASTSTETSTETSAEGDDSEGEGKDSSESNAEGKNSDGSADGKDGENGGAVINGNAIVNGGVEGGEGKSADGADGKGEAGKDGDGTTSEHLSDNLRNAEREASAAHSFQDAKNAFGAAGDALKAGFGGAGAAGLVHGLLHEDAGVAGSAATNALTAGIEGGLAEASNIDKATAQNNPLSAKNLATAGVAGAAGALGIKAADQMVAEADAKVAAAKANMYNPDGSVKTEKHTYRDPHTGAISTVEKNPVTGDTIETTTNKDGSITTTATRYGADGKVAATMKTTKNPETGAMTSVTKNNETGEVTTSTVGADGIRTDTVRAAGLGGAFQGKLGNVKSKTVTDANGNVLHSESLDDHVKSTYDAEYDPETGKAVSTMYKTEDVGALAKAKAAAATATGAAVTAAASKVPGISQERAEALGHRAAEAVGPQRTAAYSDASGNSVSMSSPVAGGMSLTMGKDGKPAMSANGNYVIGGKVDENGNVTGGTEIKSAADIPDGTSMHVMRADGTGFGVQTNADGSRSVSTVATAADGGKVTTTERTMPNGTAVVSTMASRTTTDASGKEVVTTTGTSTTYGANSAGQAYDPEIAASLKASGQTEQLAKYQADHAVSTTTLNADGSTTSISHNAVTKSGQAAKVTTHADANGNITSQEVEVATVGSDGKPDGGRVQSVTKAGPDGSTTRMEQRLDSNGEVVSSQTVEVGKNGNEMSSTTITSSKDASGNTVATATRTVTDAKTGATTTYTFTGSGADTKAAMTSVHSSMQSGKTSGDMAAAANFVEESGKTATGESYIKQTDSAGNSHSVVQLAGGAGTKTVDVNKATGETVTTIHSSNGTARSEVKDASGNVVATHATSVDAKGNTVETYASNGSTVTTTHNADGSRQVMVTKGSGAAEKSASYTVSAGGEVQMSQSSQSAMQAMGVSVNSAGGKVTENLGAMTRTMSQSADGKGMTIATNAAGMSSVAQVAGVGAAGVAGYTAGAVMSSNVSYGTQSSNGTGGTVNTSFQNNGGARGATVTQSNAAGGKTMMAFATDNGVAASAVGRTAAVGGAAAVVSSASVNNPVSVNSAAGSQGVTAYASSFGGATQAYTAASGEQKAMAVRQDATGSKMTYTYNSNGKTDVVGQTAMGGEVSGTSFKNGSSNVSVTDVTGGVSQHKVSAGSGTTTQSYSNVAGVSQETTYNAAGQVTRREVSGVGGTQSSYKATYGDNGAKSEILSVNNAAQGVSMTVQSKMNASGNATTYRTMTDSNTGVQTVQTQRGAITETVTGRGSEKVRTIYDASTGATTQVTGSSVGVPSDIKIPFTNQRVQVPGALAGKSVATHAQTVVTMADGSTYERVDTPTRSAITRHSASGAMSSSSVVHSTGEQTVTTMAPNGSMSRVNYNASTGAVSSMKIDSTGKMTGGSVNAAGTYSAHVGAVSTPQMQAAQAMVSRSAVQTQTMNTVSAGMSQGLRNMATGAAMAGAGAAAVNLTAGAVTVQGAPTTQGATMIMGAAQAGNAMMNHGVSSIPVVMPAMAMAGGTQHVAYAAQQGGNNGGTQNVMYSGSQGGNNSGSSTQNVHVNAANGGQSMNVQMTGSGNSGSHGGQTIMQQQAMAGRMNGDNIMSKPSGGQTVINNVTNNYVTNSSANNTAASAAQAAMQGKPDISGLAFNVAGATGRTGAAAERVASGVGTSSRHVVDTRTMNAFNQTTSQAQHVSRLAGDRVINLPKSPISAGVEAARSYRSAISASISERRADAKVAMTMPIGGAGFAAGRANNDVAVGVPAGSSGMRQTSQGAQRRYFQSDDILTSARSNNSGSSMNGMTREEMRAEMSRMVHDEFLRMPPPPPPGN